LHILLHSVGVLWDGWRLNDVGLSADVNLKSIYLTSHLVLPIISAQETGSFNISSVVGLRYIGKPQVGCSTTKASILSFTRITAVIYVDKGVRLNTVVPGLISTPLVRMLADRYAGGDYEVFCKTRDKQVPMDKMGTAWDVANAALLLASKEAAYISGTEIVVDGGITIDMQNMRLIERIRDEKI
jgi:NAD(P)-dependent dehydrogenase (short-subunit alcohol dehydrogenase family)